MPIKVMIIDDTAHVRSMLRSMLELDGFDVVADAGDGITAVQLVADADPDVIVVDYKMPEIDGVETARRIKADRPDQTMILYSAFLDDSIEKEAKEAGITVCLGKVSGLASLELEIRRLCEDLF